MNPLITHRYASNNRKQRNVPLFVTATVQALAAIMKGLGAVHAMNLDGGALAGIYLNGKYLAAPGRALSNALVFI